MSFNFKRYFYQLNTFNELTDSISISEYIYVSNLIYNKFLSKTGPS